MFCCFTCLVFFPIRYSILMYWIQHSFVPMRSQLGGTRLVAYDRLVKRGELFPIGSMYIYVWHIYLHLPSISAICKYIPYMDPMGLLNKYSLTTVTIVILSKENNSFIVTFLGSPCLPLKSTFLAKVPKRWRNGRGKWMASWPMPHCLKVLKSRWQRRDIVVSVPLKKSCDHQLRWVVYPIDYTVWSPEFFHRQWDMVGWSRRGEINWEGDNLLGGTEKKFKPRISGTYMKMEVLIHIVCV